MEELNGINVFIQQRLQLKIGKFIEESVFGYHGYGRNNAIHICSSQSVVKYNACSMYSKFK